MPVKNILIFCLLLSVFPALSETVEEGEKKVNDLNVRVEELTKKESDLKAKLANCENSCPQTRAELQRVKTNLRTAKQDLEFASMHLSQLKGQEQVRLSNEKKRKSAKKQIKRQKKWDTVLGLANAGMAAWMFKLCAIKKEDGWYYCALGTMNLGQIAELANKKRDLDDIESHFDTGGDWAGNSEDPPPTQPPGSQCTGGSHCDIFKILDNPPYSEGDMEKINNLVGCATANCVELDPDGNFKLVKKPDGTKIKESEKISGIDDLSPKDQAKARAAVNAFQNDPKNKPLFMELEEAEEELEEASTANQAKKAAERYSNPTRSLAGNTDDDEGGGGGGSGDSDIQNRIKDLFSQFNKKKNGKNLGDKTVTVGNDQVGNIQDNIFLMVHRRYKERRKNNQFIEKKSSKKRYSKKFI